MRYCTFLFLGFLVAGCSENNTVAPEGIVFINLQNAKADYFNPFQLDINNDGTNEYLFSASILTNEEGDHLQFELFPESTSEVFNRAGHTLVFQAGELISGNTSRTRPFKPLAVKTITETGVYWSGHWEDARDKYLGIRFTLNNIKYIGWIRLSFDKKNEHLIFHDLAYQTQPGAFISAGQVR